VTIERLESTEETNKLILRSKKEINEVEWYWDLIGKRNDITT